jgi:hypothetical protein
MPLEGIFFRESGVFVFWFFLVVLEFELSLTLARQGLYHLSHSASPGLRFELRA